MGYIVACPLFETRSKCTFAYIFIQPYLKLTIYDLIGPSVHEITFITSIDVCNQFNHFKITQEGDVMSSSNDDSLVSPRKDQIHRTRFRGWPYVGIAVIPFAVGWGLVRRRRRSRRLVRSCCSS